MKNSNYIQIKSRTSLSKSAAAPAAMVINVEQLNACRASCGTTWHILPKWYRTKWSLTILQGCTGTSPGAEGLPMESQSRIKGGQLHEGVSWVRHRVHWVTRIHEDDEHEDADDRKTKLQPGKL